MAIFREDKPSTETHHAVTTIIGKGISAEGNIGGDGDLVIEGRLKGSIVTNGAVRVGKEAEIQADIKALEVHVAGSVKGNIFASSLIEISETGRVVGDIKTKTVDIAKGAFFHGSCDMGSETPSHVAKK